MRRFCIFLISVATFCSTTPLFSHNPGAEQDTLRILGVGNSWTRDSMRWLSAIASSAGRPVIVGHGYLGGSTLRQQYYGIDDTTFTYRHRNIDQVVHNTYQYWKYTCSDTPEKTPSEGYKNGLAGIGVTLESVVKDEPWDIIVFQPTVIVKDNLPSHGDFDLMDLVRRIKRMMDPEVAASVNCGLMVPFSYPEGNTDYRKNVVDAYNNGIRPENQYEWDELYEYMHNEIQKDSKRLAEHMGSECEFIINVGKVIHMARADKRLSGFGYLLQRAQNNTHLAEGMPMYIASLCYAYTLLGLRPDEITFFPEYSAASHLTGDTGNTIKTKRRNTPAVASYARTFTFNSL